MELLADRDPEEARKILDPVLERMMEAVHRYEGTVNQVMGDGIMIVRERCQAVFLQGSPLVYRHLRAIVVENVMVRRDGAVLRLPVSCRFTLEGEIKNVVTVVAKTYHSWKEHRAARDA